MNPIHAKQGVVILAIVHVIWIALAQELKLHLEQNGTLKQVERVEPWTSLEDIRFFYRVNHC